MATYFDNFHSTFARLMPDFNLLKVGPHKTDPRAAASLIIAGMTLVLSLVVAMSLAAPVRLTGPSKSGERVAPPPAAEKVTIVAASPRLDVPCAEQTWPYIDRRCLTETTQKRPQPDARSREAAATAPPIDARSVTAPVVPAAVPPAPPASETQGNAARETAIKPDAADVTQRRSANVDSEVMQNELDEDPDWWRAVPPQQFYRGERRRLADPGQRMVRGWRDFSRRVFIFPRRIF